MLTSIFSIVSALYLGVAFSDVFLKSFIPSSWGAPCVFVSGVGFFFVVRWLRAEDVPRGRPQTKTPPAVRNTTVPGGFILWESLYSPAPLLQVRALSELTELLTQTRLQGNGHRAQIETLAPLRN